MSWVTIIWSIAASACLTLAALHLLVWCRKRTAWANLLFSLTATATAALAACEFWMMRAETPAEVGAAIRWGHLPFWALVLSLVGFVRLHMRAGRPWLAWAVCVVRTLSLILNFLFTPNLNFREITALKHIRFLGESVSIGEGARNPWMLVGQASLLLLVVFVVDATLTIWRRGDERRARLLGITMVFFTVASTGQIVLALWGIIPMPFSMSLFFMPIVVAMGLELSGEVLRAAQLSDDLRESEARMTLASEAAGFGVWMWSIDGNQIWGSERWLRLFGFALDANVTFENIIQRIHPEDREMVERSVRRALEDRVDFAGEYRVVLPDNTQRWVVARGRVFPDTQGKPIRMMGATTDITASKQAEQKAQRQHEDLAHLSRVTTVSELSGSLAHELNQPLAIILTNAQAAQRLLAQQPPDLAEAREILADIVSEDQRAGEVIRRLRSLLKHGETSLQALTVNTIVEEVLQLSRNNLIGHGITVHRGLAPTLPQVQGDDIQLQQVLLNLILNACDAMSANPPADRQLTVATTQCNGAVRISVSDTGCGLPPDAERIFEPFYTTKKHGLGLGLPICRSIVTAHKGRLWAEARDSAAANSGATFHVELPAVGEGVKVISHQSSVISHQSSVISHQSSVISHQR